MLNILLFITSVQCLAWDINHDGRNLPQAIAGGVLAAWFVSRVENRR